jgi:bifunctional UDP-N-acetylglucosamine pyrophosphorylase / glucosamine-1-phosphate N-acetyltransferase
MEDRDKKPMQFAIVIMAAGKGTRLKSKRPKVVHEIGGKALLRHVVDAARQVALPQDIYVVVGHGSDQVKACVADLGVKFVSQPEQQGTGHAIQLVRPAVQGYENLIVLSGDVPLILPETIGRLRDFHLAERATMTLLTAELETPFGYGRVLRQAGKTNEVEAIVEERDLNPEQEGVREINSGLYAFAREALYAHIDSLEAHSAQGEFYLTDMAGILVQAGLRVVALQVEDSSEVLGANTIEEMMQLDANLRLRSARRLMANGVTIFRPETTVIDADVVVGADTVIEPFVQLLGATRIGEDCRIRSYSVLENAVLGNKVLIRHGCMVSDSQVRDSALVGPYSHLRPGSDIGEGAHIGNFVETKKTRLGKGSKANHLTYLGDSEIGEQVNIGAGVITCNYDGVNKTMTLIEDGVFVGSDSTLVAPLKLSKGAYVAAGSCITEDVPEDALALGRARQAIKPGWAKRRRAGKK